MRNKKMKALMGLLLAACLVLTACVSGSKPTETTAPGASGGTESSKGSDTVNKDPFGKYDEEITLTNVRIMDASMKFNPDMKGCESLENNVWMTAYKEQLGIKIDYMWTTPEDNYLAKWNTSIAGKDIPDFAVVPGSVYQQLLEADMIEDMTDYFNDYASDLYKEATEKDGGISKDFVTVKGRMMGLPHPGAQPDNSNLLYIRRDWLKKVNMDIPKTMDDLINVARAFKQAKLGGENTVGLAICNSLIAGQCDVGGLMNSFHVYPGIWTEAADGSLIYGNVQPEMKNALQQLQDMYKEGLIQQDFAVQDGGKASELVASGRCGIAYGTFWTPLGGMMTNIVEDAQSDWVVLDGVTTDDKPYVSQGSATPPYFLFVKKGIAHPEAVVRLINLQFKLRTEQPMIYDRMEAEGDTNNSIETMYYCVAPFIAMPWKNMDNSLAIKHAMETGDVSKIEGTPLFQDYKNYMEIVNGTNEFRNNMPAFLVFGPENSSYARISEMQQSDRIYVDRFTAIPSDYMQQNLTDLNMNLLAEYLKIIMGDDINKFESAVDNWMRNGGEQITEEVNTWYQANK